LAQKARADNWAQLKSLSRLASQLFFFFL